MVQNDFSEEDSVLELAERLYKEKKAKGKLIWLIHLKIIN